MRVNAGFWQMLSMECRLGILEKIAAGKKVKR